jgi:DeoR/GlpR family transcriptional regulator of sugar metabolism
MSINEIHLPELETSPSTTPLFTQERRQHIASLIEKQQRVTVQELSAQFSVSEVTIRKDLAWLEEKNIAVRTHGGAVLATPPAVEMGFEVRERLQQSEKERIGMAAAQLVQDGDTIALDASTTAHAVAHFLKEKRELTVVTNGLRIGMELITNSGISVLIPGGMLRQEAFSLVGSWGQAVLERVHIKMAIVGARGFTLAEGLTDVHSGEIELKRAIIEKAKEVIAVIDSSKWGQVAFATFCPLERITTIVTDKEAPQEMVEQVRASGITVLLV